LITKNLLDYEEKDPGELDNHFVHEVVKILDNIEQLPGIKKAFVVDRDGSVIAKDSQENQISVGNSTEKMALIFANTVTNFETNLVNNEEEGELIEQLLVERSNGEKTLLVVSGKFIMVTEALSDCDWGLVRLSAQKSMKSIKQLTANAS
jgi:predicted regulator of Ras-like GTPase activity (Roadblock/LC7/MglB family)